MQGNCTGPAPSESELGAELQPGQCVLWTGEEIMTTSAAGEHLLWLNNLHLLVHRSPPVEERVLTTVRWDENPNNKLYVTNVTFEGDRSNSHALWIGDGASAYLGGVRFRQCVRLQLCMDTLLLRVPLATPRPVVCTAQFVGCSARQALGRCLRVRVPCHAHTSR